MAGLQHDRHVRLEDPDARGELDSGRRLEAAALRELDVGDDGEDVRLVGLVIAPRVLECPAEQDLRPRAQPQQRVRDVQRFGHEALRLAHDLGIYRRHEGRREPDVVLDQDDGLHTRHTRVVGDVPPVLDELDDGEQDAHVALPQEDAVEGRGPGLGHELLELTVVVTEQHDRRVEP